MRDDSAVGGFLEDLPVLLFVLLGVLALVSTSMFASSMISEQRRVESLDSVAEDILSAIVSGFRVGDSSVYTPTLAALRETNITGSAQAVASGCDYCVSIVMLHPRREWLCVAASTAPVGLVDTGYSKCLLNATDDDGLMAVVEVSVLAW